MQFDLLKSIHNSIGAMFILNREVFVLNKKVLSLIRRFLSLIRKFFP